MLLIRVICLTLAVLLLTERIEPDWAWYLALWVLCIASFGLISMAAGFVSFWLMIGLFEPSDAWHTVLSVFTLVSVLQALTRRSSWQSQTVVWRSRGWRGRD